jgi:hypothetical protein
MTNDEIISLARSTIQNGRDLVDVMNNEGHECWLPLLVAYNLLRWQQAEVGIPAGPDRDEILARCKAVAEMLGAHYELIPVDHPDGPGYLDVFILPHKDAGRVREGLKRAFKILRQRGYFAKANFWCCQSCGLRAIPDDKRKYVFYHAQDNDGLNERGICHLNWGGDPEEIKFICESAGLKVTWDGSKNRRIEVSAPPLN